jgi:redox-sensitive bicupin YhaK (pirin superfamily)
MHPVIAEIVLVLKPHSLAGLRDDRADFGHRRISGHVLIRPAPAEQLRVTVTDAADQEVVEVGIGPPHRGLDVLMELVQGAVLHQDAPPDRRPDAL